MTFYSVINAGIINGELFKCACVDVKALWRCQAPELYLILYRIALR